MVARRVLRIVTSMRVRRTSVPNTIHVNRNVRNYPIHGIYNVHLLRNIHITRKEVSGRLQNNSNFTRIVMSVSDVAKTTTPTAPRFIIITKNRVIANTITVITATRDNLRVRVLVPLNSLINLHITIKNYNLIKRSGSTINREGSAIISNKYDYVNVPCATKIKHIVLVIASVINEELGQISANRTSTRLVFPEFNHNALIRLHLRRKRLTLFHSSNTVVHAMRDRLKRRTTDITDLSSPTRVLTTSHVIRHSRNHLRTTSKRNRRLDNINIIASEHDNIIHHNTLSDRNTRRVLRKITSVGFRFVSFIFHTVMIMKTTIGYHLASGVPNATLGTNGHSDERVTEDTSRRLTGLLSKTRIRVNVHHQIKHHPATPRLILIRQFRVDAIHVFCVMNIPVFDLCDVYIYHINNNLRLSLVRRRRTIERRKDNDAAIPYLPLIRLNVTLTPLKIAVNGIRTRDHVPTMIRLVMIRLIYRTKGLTFLNRINRNVTTANDLITVNDRLASVRFIREDYIMGRRDRGTTNSNNTIPHLSTRTMNTLIAVRNTHHRLLTMRRAIVASRGHEHKIITCVGVSIMISIQKTNHVLTDKSSRIHRVNLGTRIVRRHRDQYYYRIGAHIYINLTLCTKRAIIRTTSDTYIIARPIATIAKREANYDNLAQNRTFRRTLNTRSNTRIDVTTGTLMLARAAENNSMTLYHDASKRRTRKTGRANRRNR